MVAVLCAATISCTDLKPLEDDIADLKDQLDFFAGMLDTNGFIDNGSIIFNDEELADTKVTLGAFEKKLKSNANVICIGFFLGFCAK